METPIETQPEESQPEVVEEKELTFVDHINMIYLSIQEAAKLKGGLTRVDSRQIKDARETLVDHFTLEEGENTLPAVTRLEIDALACLVKIIDAQQLTGVFSIDGSDRLTDSIDALSDSLTERKTSAQKLEAARRKLKGKKGGH